MSQKYALSKSGNHLPGAPNSNLYLPPAFKNQPKEEYAYRPFLFKNGNPLESKTPVSGNRFSRYANMVWALLVFLLYAFLLIMPLFFLLSAFRYMAQ